MKSTSILEIESLSGLQSIEGRGDIKALMQEKKFNGYQIPMFK